MWGKITEIFEDVGASTLGWESWILMGAVLLLIFLIWIIIQEAKRQPPSANKKGYGLKRDIALLEEIEEDQDIAVVIDKVRTAATYVQHIFKRFDQEIKTKEEDIQSKNRAVKALEERINQLNDEASEQGKSKLRKQPSGHWADPKLLRELASQSKSKAQTHLIIGIAIGFVVGIVSAFVLLNLFGLLVGFSGE